MSFDLHPIPRIAQVDARTFQREYMLPRRPVVLTQMAAGWPAVRRWDFNLLKAVAGDAMVPLYDDSKADPNKRMNEPTTQMKFADYVDLLHQGPTNLRMFAFNPAKFSPDMLNDFQRPDLMTGFLDKFPFLFFGTEGCAVFAHYDIDLPHLFHTHFVGRKRCILFPPEASTRLYKLPFAVHNIEDIDILNPDYEQWPALRGLQGYECTLEHGETLYMPTGWWHYMIYETPGFSLTQRALDPNPLRKLHSVYNVFILRGIDHIGRRLLGEKWFAWKHRRAIANANAALAKLPQPPTLQPEPERLAA